MSGNNAPPVVRAIDDLNKSIKDIIAIVDILKDVVKDHTSSIEQVMLILNQQNDLNQTMQAQFKNFGNILNEFLGVDEPTEP